MTKLAILHPLTTVSCPFQSILRWTCRVASPVLTSPWLWRKSCSTVGYLVTGSLSLTRLGESPLAFALCLWWAPIWTPSFPSTSAMCAPSLVWLASLALNAVCAFTTTALKAALFKHIPVQSATCPCQVFSIWCRTKFTRKWKSKNSLINCQCVDLV